MALHLPQPPAEGLKLVSTGIGSLLSQPNTHTFSVTEKTAHSELTAAVPHQVYFVGVNYVADGVLLGAATLAGWRYIVLDGERPLLAAELSTTREGGRLEFSHTNDGPLVEGTVEGVRIIEGLKEIRDDDYELRLLEIPALSVVALWLHAEGQDLLMPIPPTRRGLEPFSVYKEEQLLLAIRDAAAKRLQIKDARA